jgi:hypothetical protein
MNGLLPLPVSPLCASMLCRTACTLPTHVYWAVPSEVARWGTRTSASWTRCRALEREPVRHRRRVLHATSSGAGQALRRLT